MLENNGVYGLTKGQFSASPDSRDMAEQTDLVPGPLSTLPFEQLCPGSAERKKLQARLR